MRLTTDDFIMAASAVEREAKDSFALSESVLISEEDRAFMRLRTQKRLECVRKLLDEASGASSPRPSLTRDLLQDLGLTRGVLDWHEDRTFTLTLADLQRLVDAARAA